MNQTVLILTFILLCLSSEAQKSEVIVQAGHTGNVTATLFEKNRKVIVSAGTDGRLVQWNLDNGWQIGTINTETTGISSLAFSPDEKFIAVGSYNNSVHLIDYNSKSIIKRWTPFKYGVSSITFSPNGNYLVATSQDFTLWMYDFKTGKEQQVKGEDDLVAANFSPDNKFLYFGCRNGSIYKVETNKAFNKTNWQPLYKAGDEITELQLSPNGKLLSYGTAGHFKKTDEKVHGELGIIDIEGKHLLKTNDFPISITTHYQSIQWMDDNTILYTNKSDSLSSYTIGSSSVNTYPYARCSRFRFNPKNQYLAIQKDELINVFKRFQSEPFLALEGKLAIPKKLWLLKDNSLAVEYNNGFKKWDLKIGRLKTLEDKVSDDDLEAGFTVSHDGRYEVRNEREVFVIKDNKLPDQEKFTPGGLRVPTHSSLFSDDDKYLAILTDNRDLFVFNTANSFETIIALHLNLGTLGKIELPKMIFSKNEKYLAVLGKEIFVFDLTNKKLAHQLEATRDASFANLDALFNPFNDQLISASHKVYSVEEKPVDTTRKEIVYVPAGAISPNPFYLVKEPGVLKTWDVHSGRLVAEGFVEPEGYKIGDATALLLSNDGKKLYVGTSDNRVIILDVATGTQVKAVKDHNDLVFALQQLPGQKLLISASHDGTIKIRNSETLEVITTLFALKNHGYIMVDSSAHYKRSRNGASAIILSHNGLTFQPDQYDLYFNKPHIVLKGIGLSSPGLIELFSDLYGRKASSISNTSITNLVDRDIRIELLNEEVLQASTSEKTAGLQLKVSPVKTNATSLVVTVNGVPLGSENTTAKLAVQAGKSVIEKVTVPLAKGTNNISIKAYDDKGFSSSEKNFKIICRPKENIRPDLYVISISVSKYKDSTMNLKYAAKDGQDFLSLWKKDGRKALGFPSQFGKVYDFPLFNENALKENILALKDSLAKAKEEDLVILYLAGHGLLDTSYNFYFATHDIQFNQPSTRGIAYSELEGLLSNIKPLRKVMLIDACHSGAVDKSLIQTASTGTQPTGRRSSIKEYNYLGKNVKEGKDLGNTFEQMQEMFNSFNEHSGTIVISASAGNSYALESDEWNNGVFTYTIINGLRNKSADKNKDGDITIDELSAYVSLQVEELTRGRQKPTERQENTKNVFRIW